MTPTEAIRLYESGRQAEAMAALSELIAAEPDNADALFARGKLYWRSGNRSAATTDYAHAAALQPDGPAARALEMARDIESFFNPDLLNP